MKFQQLLALSLIAILLCTFASVSNAQSTPQFTEETYTIEINETFLPNFPRPPNDFVTLSCNSSNVTYTLLLPPSSNTLPFTIDNMSGALSVTSDLDYETTTSYEFEIECTSTTIVNATDRATVNVQIQPVNDNTPMVSPASVTLSFSELDPLGTVLVSTINAPGTAISRYTVTDEDTGPNNEIFYTLQNPSGNVAISNSFQFNSTYGAIVLASEFDLDAPRLPLVQLSFRITVCDESPPLPSCPNVAVNVIITSSNDNSPMFTADYYNITYSESTPTNTLLVTAPCSDADFGAGSFRGIEIVRVLPANVSDGTFVINSGTGAITLNGTLDYEFSITYEIELRCSDTSNLQDVAFVVIEVVDDNDNSPVVITGADPFVSINDATQTGNTVFTFQCSDEDSGENGNIIYSIPDTVPFTINSASGNVYVSESLQLPSDVFLLNYTITLQCQDNGTVISLANVAPLVVQVYKDDSTPPVIDDDSISNGTIQVQEDVNIGYELATATAIDDTSPSLVFSIESESAPGQFAIDSQSGAITLSRSLDREEQDTYTLSIAVTEVRVAPGTSRSVSRDLTILVTDINDNAPQCSESLYSSTIQTGTYNMQTLVSILCSDDDIGENGELTYMYTDTTPLPTMSDGSFMLNEESGEITFQGTLTRDANYSFQVTVSDSGIPTLSTMVRVEIVVIPSPLSTTESAETTVTLEPVKENPILPLYGIIVIAVVGGLLLISCLLIFCFCCCYVCNRRRVAEKRKKLLDEGGKGTSEQKSLTILSQYPMQGPEAAQPTEEMEFRLTFDTTSFSDGKPSVSPPTTPSLSSSPLDDFVTTTTTHDFDVTMVTMDTSNTTEGEDEKGEQQMNLFDSTKDNSLSTEQTQESVDMIMSKV